MGTAGRPKVYYMAAKEPHLVGFPKRRYLTLSNFMINSMRYLLGLNKTKSLLEYVGVKMGENVIKKLEFNNEISDWSPSDFERFFIKGYLGEEGAEPEIVERSDEKIVYRVHNCVFYELAIKKPELVCEVIHEGFHEGVSNGLSEKAKISRLTCMGEGDPYCEHLCEWEASN
jgi:predicted ArsR family transcriptional regulator